MVSMSKEKMLQYLKDYANIQNILMSNPSISIGRVFENYMIRSGRFEDNSKEYYDRMRRVYIAYNIFKNFSIVEDFLLNREDFLSNNDLEGMEEGCNIINAPSGLTNKKIIQIIRNAFNHNDSPDFDKFKISENGKNFEIELRDIRTKKEIEKGITAQLVKIKFDFEYLLKVFRMVISKRQNQLFLSFDIPDDFNIFSSDLDTELDKIKFIHYYFTRKMPRETIERFNAFINTSGLTNEELLSRSDEMHAFAKTISEPVVYSLDKFQKRKLKDLIVRYKTNYRDLLDDDVNAIMYYFLAKVIPIAAMKQKDIEQQVILCGSYFENPSLSIREVINHIAIVLNGDAEPSSYNDMDSELHDLLSIRGYSYSRDFFKNMLDGEFIQVFPVITYIDAVIMHYCHDDKIQIAGRVYDKEKIRNSFAHGRWYVTQDQKIIMFDADPRNINDYNLEFIGRIDIGLFEKWADDYLEMAQAQTRNSR